MEEYIWGNGLLALLVIIAILCKKYGKYKHKYTTIRANKRKNKSKKFIISSRDYTRCPNDHTDQYIQSCWDEVQKEQGKKC